MATFFQQSIVIGEKTYKFWFSNKVSFHDAFIQAEGWTRQGC